MYYRYKNKLSKYKNTIYVRVCILLEDFKCSYVDLIMSKHIYRFSFILHLMYLAGDFSMSLIKLSEFIRVVFLYWEAHSYIYL